MDYLLALLLEAPLGNTESAIADVTTVAVKVECVLKVPFVARPPSRTSEWILALV